MNVFLNVYRIAKLIIEKIPPKRKEKIRREVKRVTDRIFSYMKNFFAYIMRMSSPKKFLFVVFAVLGISVAYSMLFYISIPLYKLGARWISSKDLVRRGRNEIKKGDKFRTRGMLKVAEEHYIRASKYYDEAVKTRFSVQFSSHWEQGCVNESLENNIKKRLSYWEPYEKIGCINENLGNYDKAIENYRIVEGGGGNKNVIGIAISRIYLSQRNYTLADDWLWTVLCHRKDSELLNHGQANSTKSAFYILKSLIQYYLQINDLKSARRWLDLGKRHIRTSTNSTNKINALRQLEYQILSKETKNLGTSYSPVKSRSTTSPQSTSLIEWSHDGKNECNPDSHLSSTDLSQSSNKKHQVDSRENS